MTARYRELHFVGSVPLKPARAVFEAIVGNVGHLTARIPDGEQNGWIESIFPRFINHPHLEVKELVYLSGDASSTFHRQVPIMQLKPGARPQDVTFDGYNIANSAIGSYQVFQAMKAEGKIPATTRFQATVPTGITSGFLLSSLPGEVMIPVVEAPILSEIADIAAAIPHGELTIQLDLAVEVELEEWIRRSAEVDLPYCALAQFTMDQAVASVARQAEAVPDDIELGIHLCGAWHLHKGAGQDMQVHVDWANALSAAIKRPIAYFHLPTVPEHDVEDFAPLSDLRLHPETQLFLGVLHVVDGLQGARRRIAAAETALKGFGIAHFCGLSQWGAGPESVPPMLALHERAAEIVPNGPVRPQTRLSKVE